MGFSVVNNVAAANAQAHLSTTSASLQQAITRLSSGYRINKSGDDAAGLAVANSYRATQAVLNQGIRNANDGLSTLQIKDGALGNISTLLDRLATLATQSASASSSVNRTTLDAEFQDIIAEIEREATVAGMTASASFEVFVSNDGANGKISGTIGAADKTTLGLATAGTNENILTAAAAATALTKVTAAVTTLGTAQSNVGGLQNRLQFAVSLAQSQVVNTQAAEGRIRDADIAMEASNMARYNILTQSGMAALAQANAQGSAVLALLR